MPAVAEPSLTFGQLGPEASPKRLGTIALLIGIVVVFAFAAGFWWKYKTSQLGKAMVQTEPASAGQTTPVDKPITPPATPVSASPAPTVDATSEPVDPDASAATPQEASKFPRITGVRHWSSADSSTVVLDLEDQVQYEAHRLTGPDRIYFDLHDTQLTTDLIGKSIDDRR